MGPASYVIGDYLHTTTVREGDPEPERNDPRQMCFATTSIDTALRWACQRSLRNEDRDALFVYEVEMASPEVDTNMHGWMKYPLQNEAVTSVMAPRGRVVSLVRAIPIAECDNPMGRGFCRACLKGD